MASKALDICTEGLYTSYAYDYPMDSQVNLFRYLYQPNHSSSDSSVSPLVGGAKKLPRDNKGRFLKGYHYNPKNEFINGQVNKILIICRTCEKVFYDYSSGKRKFCSKFCYGQSILGDNNVSKREDVKIKISSGLIGITFSEDRKNNISKFKKLNYIKKKEKLPNIFKNLTPSSLWSLGMLASDGWITNYSMNFSGKIDDMEKLKSIFHSNTKILKNPACFTFSLNNKYLTNFVVNNIRIPKRKSLILNYPKIPLDYESTRHFIRGVFDGDGCVSQQKVKTTKRIIPYPTIHIGSGSEIFIKECINLLKKFNILSHFGKRKWKFNKNSIVKKSNHPYFYHLTMNGKNVLKFYDFLYKHVDNNILSNTKKEKFDRILKEFSIANSVDYRKFNKLPSK